MRTSGPVFEREEEKFRHDLDYRTEGFYIDIVDNIAAAMLGHEPTLSKSDLATLMHVTPARVTNLLRGYKTNLEIRTVVQAAMALGIEPYDLCQRRKTPEMLKRPLQAAPKAYVSADIEETTGGKEQAA